MKPTEKCLAAHRLGTQIQFMNWNAFRATYAERRADMTAALQELEIDLELPDDAPAFEEGRDAIIGMIVDHLKAERSRLGGDCYALSMYYLGYIPLELVLSASARWT